jgi:caffeoyl-CoA O-methyltransferase
MDDLINDALSAYIEKYTTAEDQLLAALNRETHVKAMMPRMLSGHVQGKFLEFIACMIKPQYILEIGTFTGYSAICLAKGLQANGKLITIDINDELTPLVKKYIAAEQMQDKIEVITGNAITIIPSLTNTFDLVFIDADKSNYSNYFDLIIDKVKPGGWILADNVLWSGHVVDEKKDKDTNAIHAFNEKVHTDTRVEQVIVSIRDGITIARKNG